MHSSFTLSIVGVACALLGFSGIVSAQSDQSDREFWRTYARMVQEFDFEKAPRHQSIFALLEIVKEVQLTGKPEFAQTLWERAKKLVGDNPSIQYRQHLFRVALSFDNLDLATEIATSADDKRKNRMLDSVSLEKLKRGVPNALKEYPREPLEFFSAIEHGNVLAECGRFEEADKFIQELAIPHEENDPRGVGAIVYSKIAEHFQQIGDLDNARKYVSKAMKIGGDLYYTGYGVKVKKYLLFDEMNQKRLTKMQKLGVAYRGHMRRELLGELIRELCLVKRFDDAQKTVAFLEKDNEKDRNLKGIAEKATAHEGFDIDSVIKQIGSSEVQVATRWSVAGRLYLNQQRDEADRIVKQELEKTGNQALTSKDVYLAMGNTLGIMSRTDEFEKQIRLNSDLAMQSRYLLEGIRGFAAKNKWQKKSTIR